MNTLKTWITFTRITPNSINARAKFSTWICCTLVDVNLTIATFCSLNTDALVTARIFIAELAVESRWQLFRRHETVECLI